MGAKAKPRVLTEEALKNAPVSNGIVIAVGLFLGGALWVVYVQLRDVEKKVNDLSTAVAASSANIVTRLDHLQERIAQANIDIDKIAPRQPLAQAAPPSGPSPPPTATINVPTQIVSPGTSAR